MVRNVVIVGGGFSGLATAAALANCVEEVTVFEQHHDIDPRFRGELIHPHGVRALQRLGLDRPLREAGAVPARGFVVIDDDGGPAAVLPYALAAGSGLGIEHAIMVRRLREVVGRLPGVHLVRGRRVNGLLREGDRIAGIIDETGAEHRSVLTIAADGSKSRLRRALGLDAEVELLSYMVALSLPGEVLPHPGFGHVFLGAPGPMLAYPYAAGRTRMCIDVPPDVPRGKAALAAFIRAAYAPALAEPLRGAVVAAADDLEVCANHRVHARRCVVPGAVLVGDAGGCSHPLTATGMTSALHDVCALADSLRDGGITAYERRRYRFVRPREALADAVYEVLRARDDGARAMKRGIMRYWRGSERARARSIAILSGEASDLGAFVTEYSLVTGLAALDVWGGVARAPALRRRARETKSLLRIALSRLGRTWRDTRPPLGRPT